MTENTVEHAGTRPAYKIMNKRDECEQDGEDSDSYASKTPCECFYHNPNEGRWTTYYSTEDGRSLTTFDRKKEAFSLPASRFPPPSSIIPLLLSLVRRCFTWRQD